MEMIIDRLSVRELATMMTLLEMLGNQSRPSELQQKFQKHMETVRSLAVATRSSEVGGEIFLPRVVSEIILAPRGTQNRGPDEPNLASNQALARGNRNGRGILYCLIKVYLALKCYSSNTKVPLQSADTRI
jgi:hypothetical protein